MTMIGKIWRLLVATLLGTETGKPDIELLSKADAIRLFTLTKPQWLQEIHIAVAGGQATATGGAPQMPGMSSTTPDGDLLTVRMDYSRGDRKPTFIQVVSGYSPPRAKLFSDRAVKDVLAEAQRQMAPEFEVIGSADRTEGGLALFVHIMEKGRYESRAQRAEVGVEPEGAASRGRLIPFGRLPGVWAGTRCAQSTAVGQRDRPKGSSYGDTFPRRSR